MDPLCCAPSCNLPDGAYFDAGLDASSAITLRREMLEAIKYKFPSVQFDDLEWPIMTPSGSPLPRKRPSNLRCLRTSSI